MAAIGSSGPNPRRCGRQRCPSATGTRPTANSSRRRTKMAAAAGITTSRFRQMAGRSAGARRALPQADEIFDAIEAGGALFGENAGHGGVLRRLMADVQAQRPAVDGQAPQIIDVEPVSAE